MSASDRFWARVHRRAAELTPAQARALARGFQAIKHLLTDREIDDVLADRVLDAAFAPFRQGMQFTTQDAIAYFGKDIPGVTREMRGMFGVLSPRVIDAVQQLDTRMVQTLKDDVREVVRQTIRKGLEEGVNPRQTARALREVIGLAPNQLEAVENYRRSLLGVDGAGSPLTRQLRDRRYDGPTRRGTMTPEQIEAATNAYRRRMIAFNAETNARTATLDSLKLGQELAWQQAKDAGLMQGLTLMKQWKGVMDDREREEHIAMEGETVPMDALYSNGEMVPGESTYNCRCLSIVFARAA